jgi:hypothetical protein
MSITQVTTTGIADDAVTSAKIATGAVGTTEIASGVSITGTLSGNASSSTTFSTNRTNYKNITDGAVAGQMMWKNYGNGHTIFDASQSISPDGTSVNNTDPQVPWTGTYPTLMGWNGGNTYGVRVDSAGSCSGVTYAQNQGSMSINLFLPSGIWVVEMFYTGHYNNYPSLSMFIDGAGIYATPDNGDPQGTSYIPLFGISTVSGGRTINCAIAGQASSYPGSERIVVKAIRIS